MYKSRQKAIFKILLMVGLLFLFYENCIKTTDLGTTKIIDQDTQEKLVVVWEGVPQHPDLDKFEKTLENLNSDLKRESGNINAYKEEIRIKESMRDRLKNLICHTPDLIYGLNPVSPIMARNKKSDIDG